MGGGWNGFRMAYYDRSNNSVIIWYSDCPKNLRVPDVRPQTDPARTQTHSSCTKHKIASRKCAVHVGRFDIIRTQNVDKAGGIVKYVEFFVSEGRFVLLDGSIRILLKIREKILFAFIRKPLDPLLIFNDYKPPWLPISSTRRKAAVFDNLLDKLEGNLFFIKVSDGSPPLQQVEKFSHSVLLSFYGPPYGHQFGFFR